MAVIASDLALRTELSEDLLSATLVIAGDFDRQLLDTSTVMDVLDQAGVVRTEAVEAAVAQLVASPPPMGLTAHVEITRGRPAHHAQDGQLHWLVDDAPTANQQSHSFYDRSAFTTVAVQQIIGHIQPPTKGIDGLTVTGQALVARQGKPVTLKFDDSITLDAKGQLIAQREGILRRTQDRATIAELLVVENNVDFSTGNIDFHGDVHVKNDVRDCFVVKATGTVEVTGLIEAATIECGHNLLANGGLAGRDRGQITVHGDVVAKYLDAVSGTIGGNLRTQRELINCKLVIHGNIDAPQSSIIGGRLTVQGSVHIASIGSAAAVPTELVLDTVPALDPFAQHLRELLVKFDLRYTTRLEELDHLKKMCVRGNVPEPVQAQLKSLAATIRRLDQRRQVARLALERLTQHIESKRTLNVTVDKRVHPGVCLTIGDRSYCITTDLKGPVTFRRDSRGAFVYAHGETTLGLLAQITCAKHPTK